MTGQDALDLMRKNNELLMEEYIQQMKFQSIPRQAGKNVLFNEEQERLRQLKHKLRQAGLVDDWEGLEYVPQRRAYIVVNMDPGRHPTTGHKEFTEDWLVRFMNGEFLHGRPLKKPNHRAAIAHIAEAARRAAGRAS